MHARAQSALSQAGTALLRGTSERVSFMGQGILPMPPQAAVILAAMERQQGPNGLPNAASASVVQQAPGLSFLNSGTPSPWAEARHSAFVGPRTSASGLGRTGILGLGVVLGHCCCCCGLMPRDVQLLTLQTPQMHNKLSLYLSLSGRHCANEML